MGITPYFDPCASYLVTQCRQKSEMMARPGKQSKMVARYEKNSEKPDLSADRKNPFADPKNPFADPEDPLADSEDPCTDLEYSLADLEDLIASPSPKSACVEQVFRAKLITRVFAGLDFTHHDVDFVSFNVDKSNKPKALQCSERITTSPTPLPVGKRYMCPLCEDPDNSKLLRGLKRREKEFNKENQGKGKGKDQREQRQDVQETGKENAILQKSAKIGKSFAKGIKFRFLTNERTGDSSAQWGQGWEQL